jgi:glycogen synthase
MLTVRFARYGAKRHRAAAFLPGGPAARLFARTRSVLTIHNIGHQGTFAAQCLADTGLGAAAQHFHQDQLREGRINYLLTGILYADAITTVSPTYAREIQTPEHGAGLDGFLRMRGRAVVGILNGIDDDEWSPDRDARLTHRNAKLAEPARNIGRVRVLGPARKNFVADDQDGGPTFPHNAGHDSPCSKRKRSGPGGSAPSEK